MDGVDLSFTDEALVAVAEEAIRLRTGARGLRTVVEDRLVDVMYEIPSRDDIDKCVVNTETITKHNHPILMAKGGQTAYLDDDKTLEVREESA